MKWAIFAFVFITFSFVFAAAAVKQVSPAVNLSSYQLCVQLPFDVIVSQLSTDRDWVDSRTNCERSSVCMAVGDNDPNCVPKCINAECYMSVYGTSPVGTFGFVFHFLSGDPSSRRKDHFTRLLLSVASCDIVSESCSWNREKSIQNVRNSFNHVFGSKRAPHARNE